MRLQRVGDHWRMKTSNASSRAWSLGGESWKDFANLADVEAKYKSWRGISALLESATRGPTANFH